MPIERIVIKNFQRWGQLVKTWSTGVNHIGDGNNYPKPATIFLLCPRWKLLVKERAHLLSK